MQKINSLHDIPGNAAQPSLVDGHAQGLPSSVFSYSAVLGILVTVAKVFIEYMRKNH